MTIKVLSKKKRKEKNWEKEQYFEFVYVTISVPGVWARNYTHIGTEDVGLAAIEQTDRQTLLKPTAHMHSHSNKCLNGAPVSSRQMYVFAF